MLHVAALLLTGAAAGVASTVVSLATIVSYPALLALGLPPLTANVTNTVALVFAPIGAAASSRQELAGQRDRALRLAAATAAGGATGAALLLLGPERAFESVAPFLVAGAALVLLAQPRLVRPRHRHPRWLPLGAFTVAIYAGYFGAAGGVLMLALLAASFDQSLARNNALKNTIAGASNGVAALAFALFGPVRWDAVPPLAVGFLAGGWVGPRLVRRLPGQSLRYLAAGCALAVAATLAVGTYT